MKVTAPNNLQYKNHRPPSTKENANPWSLNGLGYFNARFSISCFFRRLNTSPLIRKVEQRHKLIHAAGARQFSS